MLIVSQPYNKYMPLQFVWHDIAVCPALLTEHCPKLLSTEQRGPERSPWAVATRPHWRRTTEAAGWSGMKMMMFQVRGMAHVKAVWGKWKTKLNSPVCMRVFQYQTTVSRCPAALCEHQRSPPWSSWWSSPVSVTTSDSAWAPSLPAHLAPSQASSSGSQPWTDSTPSAAGINSQARNPDKGQYCFCSAAGRASKKSWETCWSLLVHRWHSVVLSTLISRIYSPSRSFISLDIPKGQWGVLLYLIDVWHINWDGFKFKHMSWLIQP